LIPIAVIPQLIKNEKESDEMQDVISPFYLIVYPASICLELPEILNLNIEASWKDKRLNVKTLGMLTRLFLYTIWLIQYAKHDHYKSYSTAFAGIFSIIIFAIIVTFFITYTKGTKKYNEAEKNILF